MAGTGAGPGVSGSPSDNATFNELIGEIAFLDETYQERGLTVEEYRAQRQELMQKAKRLSEIEESLL